MKIKPPKRYRHWYPHSIYTEDSISAGKSFYLLVSTYEKFRLVDIQIFYLTGRENINCIKLIVLINACLEPSSLIYPANLRLILVYTKRALSIYAFNCTEGSFKIIFLYTSIFNEYKNEMIFLYFCHIFHFLANTNVAITIFVVIGLKKIKINLYWVIFCSAFLRCDCCQIATNLGQNFSWIFRLTFAY